MINAQSVFILIQYWYTNLNLQEDISRVASASGRLAKKYLLSK